MAVLPLFQKRYLIVLMILAVCVAGWAQTESATISGTVTDPSGAIVVGADVKLTNVQTGTTVSTVSNNTGLYVFFNVRPGHYRMTVHMSGFRQMDLTDLAVNVQDTLSRNFALQIGVVGESVTISGEATKVSTSASVGTVVDREFVGNLPLNGRSFQSLINLTPGVVITPIASNNPFGGAFSTNGQRSNANAFSVDGVSANIGMSLPTGQGSAQSFSSQAGGAMPGLTAFGGTNNLVSIDALEEFRIQTSTFSAEYGRQPGGQIALTSRSGTNHYHGSAADYLRNDVFDAANWFVGHAGGPAKKLPLRQNQFSGTFGGPVRMPMLYNGADRTFFFFSYEGQRVMNPSISSFQDAVPSLRWRQTAPDVLKPFLNSFPIPNTPEYMTYTSWSHPDDPSQMVPSGLAYYNKSYSNPSSMDAVSVRLDHTINAKLILFGRFSNAPSDSMTRDMNTLTGNKNGTRTLTLGVTSTLSSVLSNEFRFNYSRSTGDKTTTMDNYGGAVPVTLSQLTSGYSGGGTVQGQLTFASFNYVGGTAILQLGDAMKTYQRQMNYVDNFSWARGKHQFKFGVDYKRLTPIFAPVAFQQSVSFQTEQEIMAASPTSLSRSSNREIRPLYTNLSLFGQDSWRVTPRLTVDLGLRYELNPAPTEASGLKPIVVTGLNDVATAHLADANAPFYKTFYTAFAPRVGAAYQLNSKSGRETVLRGGFGVYYDLGSEGAASGYGTFPFNVSSSSWGVPLPFPVPESVAPLPPWNKVPAGTASDPITSKSYGFDPNLSLPYTLQWNVALQQSLSSRQSITVSYVASAARRQLAAANMNLALPDNSRVNRGFATIYYMMNGPTADYNSLQVQYQTRLTKGLQANVNYTWAHSIDQVSSSYSPGTMERGNADNDIRHNFSAALYYETPKVNANRFINSVVHGWALSSTIKLQSGAPIDMTAGTLVQPDGTLQVIRPDAVPGQPFYVNAPDVAGGKIFNKAAFVEPPYTCLYPYGPSYCVKVYTRQGTLGRNVVRWVGLSDVSMSLQRRFNLTERLKLQAAADVFNPFNHPQFGHPDPSLAAIQSAYGTHASGQTMNVALGGLGSLYQVGGPRSMQMSLKLAF